MTAAERQVSDVVAASKSARSRRSNRPIVSSPSSWSTVRSRASRCAPLDEISALTRMGDEDGNRGEDRRAAAQLGRGARRSPSSPPRARRSRRHHRNTRQRSTARPHHGARRRPRVAAPNRWLTSRSSLTDSDVLASRLALVRIVLTRSLSRITRDLAARRCGCLGET